jgi:prolyl oligopeptidase
MPQSAAVPTAPTPVALNPSPAPRPATRRDDVTETLHGETLTDPYRWLEGTGEEVQAWVKTQNAAARGYLDGLAARATVAKRAAELLYLDAIHAPVSRGGSYFFTRRFKDREKAVLMVQAQGAEARTLLDPNLLSNDGSVSLGAWFVSWDGKQVAYTLHHNNADEATLYLRDVATLQDSKTDVIEGARYAGPNWTPDSKSFYYEYLPPREGLSVAERPGFTELRLHQLGGDPKNDRVVFPATRDAKTFLHGGLSRDGRWLSVTIQHGWTRNDTYVRDLHAHPLKEVPKALREATPALSTAERVAQAAEKLGFVPLFRDQNALLYATWWNGAFYAITNYGAPRYRVLRAEPGPNPKAPFSLDQFREIIPEGTANLQNLEIIGNRLVLHYLDHAASELRVHALSGKFEGNLSLPAMGSVEALQGDPERDEAFFSFSSFTQPPEVYRAPVSTRASQPWSRVELPLDTSAFAVSQRWFPSKDGTKISMFIVERKDQVGKGPRPTLLYGYGGFNVSLTPHFSVLASIWVEQGGVYAVPNLRGGGEYGEAWHRSGMLANKQNVFDDFAGAARYLVAENYTRPASLGVYGGSNGGLLVGAALTQYPELFGAVVCAVPLLDMVRYHLFGSGRTWIEEYGSAENAADFKVLHAYSPYHHLKPGAHYPPLLMLAADSDDRVDPLHARKFTAALQAVTPPEVPVLFRLEVNAGHGGADLVQKQVASSADLIAFLRSVLQPGLDATKPSSL